MSAARATSLASDLQRRLDASAGPVRVEAAGRDGEVAVLVVGPGALAVLLRPDVRREVAERARAAGFRHAAVDLELDGPPADPASVRGGEGDA
ncbi:MAG TPA: hypothetical protein VKA44_05765 [Gemmatimonadota bacterium]|nr:hypothetical protein [Gemmatimonadota bacterium]